MSQMTSGLMLTKEMGNCLANQKCATVSPSRDKSFGVTSELSYS
jgi:hypothetical protein